MADPVAPAASSDNANAASRDVGARGVTGLQHIGSAEAGGAAILNGEVEVFFNRPLPAFDRGAVKAYAAQFRTESRGAFYALIAEPNLIPRTAAAPAVATLLNPSLTRLVSTGPLYWPPAKAARYAFVYEDKLGQPLVPSLDQMPGLGWRQDIVMRAIVRPLHSAIGDLHAAGLFHGAINPFNLYDGGQKQIERVVLGDFLSSPPGSTQGAAFETIERGSFDPLGRGPGTLADDLYSFGATLAFILRRRDPLAGKSAEDIVREKIEHGSYNALLGTERITGAMLELIRGLLYDDPQQRWTLADIETWLNGQHPSSRQSTKKKRAARPLDFNGKSYERPVLLAMDLHTNLSATAEMVENGALEQWITRSVDDNALKSRLAAAIQDTQAQGRGGDYPDRLAMRLAMALNAEGPIVYKNMKFGAAGFPTMLADAAVQRRDLQPFAEIINHQAIMTWLKTKANQTPADVSDIARYDACRTFLRHSTLGYGIERCLYFLNPDVPCLSDRLRRYFVRTPEDLMYALDIVAAQQASAPELLIDRHVAAFLSVRDRKAIDIFASELNAPEQGKRALGNVKVLAAIQRRARLGAFPALSAWADTIIEPVYKRYRDRELRKRLRDRMTKLKGEGDLLQISNLFEDADLLAADLAGFRQAQERHQALRFEEERIGLRLEKPETYTSRPAREAAAITAGIIAGILIVGLILIHAGGGTL